MKSYIEAQKADIKRRRRERYIIAFLMVIIPVLTYVGARIFDLGLDLPIANNILILVLININVILLLLLLYLTMRNLVKLFFERKKGMMGAKLRTKLVVAFMTLSLLPTAILFFVSVQFISTSIEYWFNLPIERSLKNSLEVGQGYYKRIIDELLSHGNSLSRLITYYGYTPLIKKEEMEKLLNDKRMEYHLATVKVFSENMQLRSLAHDEKLDLSSFKDLSADILRVAFEKGSDHHHIQSSTTGQLVSGIVPIFSKAETKAVVGLAVMQAFIPAAVVNRLNAIPKGFEEFKQFKLLKKPIKIIHLITFSIVTLLIIFASVWFGIFLSKGITVPIQELAEGTYRIAQGDYDVFIDLESRDEMGVLVNSFNRMATDLKNGKLQLEEANKELIRRNLEIEQRRLYMEIVLANVAAGVMSADAGGRIFTINKSAEKMLGLDASAVIGRDYREALNKPHLQGMNDFFQDENLFKKGAMKRQIHLHTADRTLTLLVSLNVLRDEKDRYLGLVAVFEDLTDIERAQRMAAWREVARRIAHEVKNPLTPIQLSAQRLKKRYGHKLSAEDSRVFEECTTMIIDQVEGLKSLVNAFSSYARMPAPQLEMYNMRLIIEESVALYRDIQKGVTILFHDAIDVPSFRVDREQMKRVMVNLLDNAIDAVKGEGRIDVTLSFNQDRGVVVIEIADDGPGVPPEHKARVFEPYFSTKKHGTGLGLAIVSDIISDHNGSISIQARKIRGTRVIIELPVKA
ncbi:MAG: HAMP domain-containing protein [Deltaproteobacteria bacterium]|nr:HAMP domain-containing protein [Deltaproteobacteria bacterium]